MPADARFVHATVVVVGECGILIRGDSGTGKSALALALIDAVTQAGRFARLVGDDRVSLLPMGDRLVAQGHPAVTGLIEERGTGLLAMPYEPRAVVRCIVDLVPDSGPLAPARMPEANGQSVEVSGVHLPRIVLKVSAYPQEGARRILSLLARYEL